MAKAQASKKDGSNVPQKHLYSRLSFLHQAATLLTKAEGHPRTSHHEQSHLSDSSAKDTGSAEQGLPESTRLLSHLRGVSRKSQIRIAPELKHAICKRCDCLLIPGRTSTEIIKNDSRNGNKTWADVLEVRCNKCGTTKRFPVGAIRQKERPTEVD
ncbi:hypothetical protein PV08_03839 [Exophiala spinifera]|uniref:Rpr2-domain-containing protein n=1 Tax=Exophiala spinifera TaxID=91928 RepID=A0A0D1YNI6_9EURO|nr:uncharacterized protein PV08_03839 [Exophiala spinifera]KIW16651.1 hypothetical protein PV08_03839 [Exophiala spinifera]